MDLSEGRPPALEKVQRGRRAWLRCCRSMRGGMLATVSKPLPLLPRCRTIFKFLDLIAVALEYCLA